MFLDKDNEGLFLRNVQWLQILFHKENVESFIF